MTGGVDEDLLELRQTAPGDLAANLGIHRQRPPADDLQSFGADLLTEHALRLGGHGGVGMEKDHADGEDRRQGRLPLLFRDRAEKLLRHLQHEPAAVTRLAIGRDGASVRHAAERMYGRPDQVVAGFAATMRDHSESTIIADIIRAVEPLRAGSFLHGQHP